MALTIALPYKGVTQRCCYEKQLPVNNQLTSGYSWVLLL